jgi:hypothetical protein
MSLRYHRNGEDAGDYDLEAEPLCSAFGATDFLYLPTDAGLGRNIGTSKWCRWGGG